MTDYSRFTDSEQWPFPVSSRAKHQLCDLEKEVVDATKRIMELEAVMRQALEALEHHAIQRTFAGGVHICNAANALREALGEKA